MKHKKLILSLLCSITLVFAMIFLNSCSKDDVDIEEVDFSQGNAKAELNEKTANLVLNLTQNENIVNEIYQAVDKRTLGETSILFDYLLNGNVNLKSGSTNLFASRFLDLVPNNTTLKSAGGGGSNSKYLNDLKENNVQIYWPYHDEWDGKTLPTVTFYDGVNDQENIGYRFNNDGSITSVTVNEDYAWENPVWVINCYDGSPEEYLAMEAEKKSAKTNDYYSKAALKNGSNTDNHVSVKINQVRCVNDVTDYEGILGGNLEMRWARGNVIDWQNNIDQMKLTNNTVYFSFDRKRARKGWWTYVESHWVTDWTKTDPNYMMGVFEQDAGDWKAAGSGTLTRKKSTEENITINADLNVDIGDIKYTSVENTQTDSEVNVTFNWKVESKENVLGSMEWTRSWVCQNFIGTTTVESFSGIQCRIIVDSWN